MMIGGRPSNLSTTCPASCTNCDVSPLKKLTEDLVSCLAESNDHNHSYYIPTSSFVGNARLPLLIRTVVDEYIRLNLYHQHDVLLSLTSTLSERMRPSNRLKQRIERIQSPQSIRLVRSR
eukprot:scaffold80942_cov17-Prasinocladus_malaysianus.AAC.1